MALEYVVKKRVMNFDPEKAEKYVLKSLGNGEISFGKLCTRVSQICGAHRGTVQLVVAGLVDVMINEIGDGKALRLGEFGLFRPVVRSKSGNSAEEVTARSVYRRSVRFVPGTSLKEAVKKLSVVHQEVEEDEAAKVNGSGGGNSGDGGNSGGGEEESGGGIEGI